VILGIDKKVEVVTAVVAREDRYEKLEESECKQRGPER